MEFSTADLCDAHSTLLDDGRLAVLAPVFRMFGKRTSFAGPAVTLKVFEDNALLRSTLAGPGQGRVLVVDGGGSLRRALVGSELALLGQDNGWAGIVLNGCVRDCAEINACDIGIRALAAQPLSANRACACSSAACRSIRATGSTPTPTASSWRNKSWPDRSRPSLIPFFSCPTSSLTFGHASTMGHSLGPLR
jgi:regulator of ribonuclease activity A